MSSAEEHTSEKIVHDDDDLQGQGRAWSADLTRSIADEIRRWRIVRDLSAQALSNRTEQLGLRIPRSVIANLENGRRDTIGIAEVLILAAALDIPPMMLVAPVGWRSEMEILPGLVDNVWRSRGWLMGAVAPEYQSFSLAGWQEGRRAIALYDLHRLLIAEYQQIQSRIRRLADASPGETSWAELLSAKSGDGRLLLADAATELAYSIDRLRQHRNLIRAEGYVLPVLPPPIARALREPDLGRHTAEASDEPPPAWVSDSSSEDLAPPVIYEMLRKLNARTQHQSPD